jgi:hypothetical protein
MAGPNYQVDLSVPRVDYLCPLCDVTLSSSDVVELVAPSSSQRPLAASYPEAITDLTYDFMHRWGMAVEAMLRDHLLTHTAEVMLE